MQASVSSALVIVDKPQGWTSHDVVGKVRRLAGTRKVGHAGTLDPMATGVLVLGVEKATKLLSYIVGTCKTYHATIRLGAATLTDDAEGEVVATAPTDGLTDAAVREQIAALSGELQQVPSSVSAIKVNGERAYAKVRAGQQVQLAARAVTVYEFTADEFRRTDPFVDVDVTVQCSSGTYIRALARDLGAALGVGGHLTALRRTQVGPFAIAQAQSIPQLEQHLHTLDLSHAARELLPVRELSAPEAAELSYGRRIGAGGAAHTPVAGFAPDGTLVALLEDPGPAGQWARPQLVLAPAG